MGKHKITKKGKELFFKDLATEAGLLDEKLAKQIYYAIIRVALNKLVINGEVVLPDLISLKTNNYERVYKTPYGVERPVKIRRVLPTIDYKIRRYIKNAAIIERPDS